MLRALQRSAIDEPRALGWVGVGLLAEYFRKRKSKTWKNSATIKHARLGHDTYLSSRSVHVNELLPWEDDPNNLNPCEEVLLDLFQEFLRVIVRAYDFDGKVRDDAPSVILARDRPSLGPALEGDKGCIGPSSPFSRRWQLE